MLLPISLGVFDDQTGATTVFSGEVVHIEVPRGEGVTIAGGAQAFSAKKPAKAWALIARRAL